MLASKYVIKYLFFILFTFLLSCQNNKVEKCEFIKDNIELWNYVTPQKTPYDEDLDQKNIYLKGFKAGTDQAIKNKGYEERICFFPKDKTELVYIHGFNDGRNLIYSMIKLYKEHNDTFESNPFEKK